MKEENYLHGRLGGHHMEDWDEARERKAHSARCGHVKRRLFSGAPLTGKTLDFALELLSTSRERSSEPQMLEEMAKKLVAHVPLTEYEQHILVDVLLVHSKIAGRL